jgi:hypothetical protein
MTYRRLAALTFFGATTFCAAVSPGAVRAWESSELYIEERDHLRLDLAFPSDFNADPAGHAVVLALGARLRLSDYRGRDHVGLVVHAPFVGRFDFNRFDVGNVLLALEHRPTAWTDDDFQTSRDGLRYGVMLPTLSVAHPADNLAQRRNLALALGGLSMLDSGHFVPGVVGATFDYFYSNFERYSDGASLVEYRAGAAMLVPIDDAASFALPVHLSFRAGFGGSIFLFCFGATMAATVGRDVDRMGAAITASTGVLAQLDASRVELMFDIGGAFGPEFTPSLITTMRLGWTLVL